MCFSILNLIGEISGCGLANPAIFSSVSRSHFCRLLCPLCPSVKNRIVTSLAFRLSSLQASAFAVEQRFVFLTLVVDL